MYPCHRNAANKRPPKSRLFHINPAPEDDTLPKKLLGSPTFQLNEKRVLTGRSHLHVACLNKNVRLANLLLKNGDDVNACDRSFDTPLHIVARVGSPAIAKILLDHGADLSLCNKNGNTALHVAHIAEQKETARAILENGTDLTTFLSAKDIDETHTNKMFTWICDLAFSIEEPDEPEEVILRPYSRASFY